MLVHNHHLVLAQSKVTTLITKKKVRHGSIQLKRRKTLKEMKHKQIQVICRIQCPYASP